MEPRAKHHRATRDLVSIPAAAEQLGCSDRTIRRYIAAGTLTGYRIGQRMIRVDSNEVDQLLRQIPAAG